MAIKFKDQETFEEFVGCFAVATDGTVYHLNRIEGDILTILKSSAGEHRLPFDKLKFANSDVKHEFDEKFNIKNKVMERKQYKQVNGMRAAATSATKRGSAPPSHGSKK